MFNRVLDYICGSRDEEKDDSLDEETPSSKSAVIESPVYVRPRLSVVIAPSPKPSFSAPVSGGSNGSGSSMGSGMSVKGGYSLKTPKMRVIPEDPFIEENCKSDSDHDHDRHLNAADLELNEKLHMLENKTENDNDFDRARLHSHNSDDLECVSTTASDHMGTPTSRKEPAKRLSFLGVRNDLLDFKDPTYASTDSVVEAIEGIMSEDSARGRDRRIMWKQHGLTGSHSVSAHGGRFTRGPNSDKTPATPNHSVASSAWISFQTDDLDEESGKRMRAVLKSV